MPQMILATVIIIALYASFPIFKGHVKKKTLEHILWCIGDINELISTIRTHYAHANTPSQFRLSGRDEWYYAERILSAFQYDTDNGMRKDRFYFKWSLSRLTSQQYFYMIFRDFLIQFYEKNKTSDDVPVCYLENADGELTDVGIAYHKLLYVVTEAATLSRSMILAYSNPSQNLPTKSNREYYHRALQLELDAIKASIVRLKRITRWTINE